MSPRLPPVTEGANAEESRIIDRIVDERGSFLMLYRVLMNSPPVAEGWLNLFTAIRQKAELPGRYRELVILRVAARNGARYEYEAHVPFAVEHGLPQASTEAIWQGQIPPELDETDRLVLGYTDAITTDITVPDALHAQLAELFPRRQMLELAVTAAGYNMVSRLLVAMQIEHEAHPPASS